MKKKKISILTFSKGDNYGAVLQAYSLAEVLRRMGHEVEFIYLTWTNWKEAIITHLTPLGSRYEKFRKRYLRNFSKRCYNADDLREVTKDSDVCIVGSDQVWNPDITTIRSKYYFFDFLPENIKRISYAASFGVNEWKWKDLSSDVKALLSKFDAVSVRERSGVEICKKEFEVDACQVLDPTLLLGNFDEFFKKEKDYNGYVLGFKYATSPAYYRIMTAIAEKLNVGIKIVAKLSKITDKETRRLNPVFLPAPERWINEIANSRFVITDSFHFLAFALIFKKDFIVFPTSENNRKLQGRLYSLLESLGLTDRIFYSMEEVMESKVWERPINYDEVDKRLSALRKESLDFLVNALKG